MTRMVKATLALAGLGLAASAAAAQGFRGGETSIPFAANGGIRDWHSDDDQSIYIMDRTGRWYHATFTHRCSNLRLENTVSFETDTLGRFDRFSRVDTPYMRCQVASIVRSPRPAAKGGKGRD